MKILIPALAVCQFYTTSAFTSNSIPSSTFIHHHGKNIISTSPKQSNVALSALPSGGGINELMDIHQSVSQFMDSLSTSSTTLLVSDAVEAIVEEEQSSGGGLWESYLQIFKSCLEIVHSTIDAPLRSIGWDQTWGVSIFLFTACESILFLC